jgi:hypothetical protein
MILPLALLLLATPPHAAPAPARSDPAVKVWLNSDRIEPGDWARARVRVADDGYLLVLAADPEGRVRVLFPLDPSEDAFVRGGRTVDLRGRGSRGSFLVGDAGGTGVVLAARNAAPLRLAGFVRGDHWDYGALDSAAHGAGAGAGAPRNPDELLLGLAQQLAGGNQLDYDAASYTVDGDVASTDRPYTHPSYDAGWDYGYAYPTWYGCYDPWFCGPGFYSSFAFGFYGPFAYRPFIGWPVIGRPFLRRPGYPRVYGAYGTNRYIQRPARYRDRSQASSGSRGFGGMRARPSFAPPRFAAPRGGRGGGGGRRGR